MKPLLVIVGSTASGKTDLAIRLAEKLNGEIICADSWTVRRGVNIGTAKPTAREQARVPHHLLDVVDPDGDFTAAVFKRLALAMIDEITAKGKLPIMVGGTGLYVDGVIYDFNFLPPADPALREELNDLQIPDLLEKIDDLGIELGSVDTRNKRRLIRLIETNGAAQTRQELRANTLVLGLKTDRATLRARVETRVDNMLAAGLEVEVRDLVERYGWQAEALKGVGYAQWKGYFEGQDSLDITRQKIIKATLDLAKRQRTWFKRNKSIHWFTTPVNWTKAVDTVTTFLSSKTSETNQSLLQ